MENMEIPKLAIKTSLPMIISMISIALYGIVDTIFVSNISESALTAITLGLFYLIINVIILKITDFNALTHFLKTFRKLCCQIHFYIKVNR